MAKVWKVVLADLNVKNLQENGDYLVGPCPVHEGRRYSSFNLNIDENSDYFGNWFCNSHKCHERFGRDMVGLIRGLLSKDTDNLLFGEVLKFCQPYTLNVQVNYTHIDNITNFFSKEKKNDKKLITREEVRKRLIIPSEYYISRGFSPEILDEFDVGLCETPNTPMFNRVVFPVYEETGKYMVGCVGRTVVNSDTKWFNSKGFSKSSHLYGYHKALKRAKELGALILVEGQGDTIRMHEAGIGNTVGIFGSSLSDSQEFLIQKSGVLNIVLAMDSDDAGRIAYENLKKRLKDLFNVHKLEVPAKDIGDLKVEEVKKLRNQLGKFV